MHHYRLLLIGEFSNPMNQLIDLVINQQFHQLVEKYSIVNPTKPTVETYNLEQFRLLAPESFIQAFTLVISSENVIMQAKDCKKTNTLFIACNQGSDADIYISEKVTEKSLLASFNMGFEILTNRHQLVNLSKDIQTVSQERKEISDIGIAMSAEKDLNKLLTMVLKEGRKLGHCEAASLYLLHNENSDNPELIFKLTQNSEMEFDFKEMHFPLTNQSLSGYVALTGEILNIADAHHLDENLPYHFDKSFDKATGYRTRQMLVMPMRNHKGKIIGVLQFINNKKADKLSDKNLGFDNERKDLIYVYCKKFTY